MKSNNWLFSKSIVLVLFVAIQLTLNPLISARSLSKRDATNESRTDGLRDDLSSRSLRDGLETEEGGRTEEVDDDSAFPTTVSPDEKLDGSRYDFSDPESEVRGDTKDEDGDSRSDDIIDDGTTTTKPTETKSRTSILKDEDKSRSGDDEESSTSPPPNTSHRSSIDEKEGSRNSLADLVHEEDIKDSRTGLMDDEDHKGKSESRTGMNEKDEKVKSDENSESHTEVGKELKERHDLGEADGREDVHHDSRHDMEKKVQHPDQTESSPFEPRSTEHIEESKHSRLGESGERSGLRPLNAYDRKERKIHPKMNDDYDDNDDDDDNDEGDDEDEDEDERSGFGSRHGADKHSTLGSDEEKGENRSSDLHHSMSEGEGRSSLRADIKETTGEPRENSQSRDDDDHFKSAELKNDETAKSRDSSDDKEEEGLMDSKRKRHQSRSDVVYSQSETQIPNVDSTTITSVITTLKPLANTESLNQKLPMKITMTTKMPDTDKKEDIISDLRDVNPEKVLAVVVNKDGHLVARKPNAKVFAKIFESHVENPKSHALSVEGNYVTISANNTFLFPPGSYYFPRALRFAGFW